MPSYLDLGVVGIILVSALLAMLRGFTREVFAILSWALAGVAAYYFYPALLPKLKSVLPGQKDQVYIVIAGASIFLVALVIVSIITVRISDAVLDSKIGAVDRSLGFLFGAARGLLLCAVAFMLYVWIAPKNQPDWVTNAKFKPLLSATSEAILKFVPEDPEGIIAQFKKAKDAPKDEQSPDSEGEANPKPSPPTSPPTLAPTRNSAPPASSPAPVQNGLPNRR